MLVIRCKTHSHLINNFNFVSQMEEVEEVGSSGKKKRKKRKKKTKGAGEDAEAESEELKIHQEPPKFEVNKNEMHL